jgi:hypothetical protein
LINKDKRYLPEKQDNKIENTAFPTFPTRLAMPIMKRRGALNLCHRTKWPSLKEALVREPYHKKDHRSGKNRSVS